MVKRKFIPKISNLASDVLPKIQPACGPLFFTTSLEKVKGNVVGNGTYSLITTTSKKHLLVTCYHVWNDFLKERELNLDQKFCTCLDEKNPVSFCTMLDETKNQPIDQNKDLDIATFDMTPFLSLCAHKNFFFPSFGTQSQLNEQDPIVIIGYPGNLRTEWDNGILFGRVPFVGFVASISGYKIMMDFTRMMTLDGKLAFAGGKSKAFGGLSGAPCFVIRQNYEPFLVGFVTEHISFGSVDDNFLQITTSNCINEDGTIKPASYFNNT